MFNPPLNDYLQAAACGGGRVKRWPFFLRCMLPWSAKVYITVIQYVNPFNGDVQEK
jgi:hypothetical protein